MAVIYLEHPLHGQKVACSDSEARYDKGNGWREFDPNALKLEAPNALKFEAPKVELPESKIEVPSFLKVEPENKLKPGRKPKE